MGIFLSVNATEGEDEAKHYASIELNEKKTIRPLLTLYRGSEKFVSFQFPDHHGDQDFRSQCYRWAAFAVTSLHASATRFIVDSFMEVTVPVTGTQTMDALVVAYGNNVGCQGAAFPYIIHPESSSPIWQDDNSITSEQILNSQPQLVRFMASCFFMSGQMLPAFSYLRFMEEKGFEIMYHGAFTKDNLGIAIHTVV